MRVDEQAAAAIAHDLVDDKDSPIGPVLQIALTRMWEDVTRSGKLQFDTDVYRRSKLRLQDFLTQQLQVVGREFPHEVASGLALDLLWSLTTPFRTTISRPLTEIEADYGTATRHVTPLIECLKTACLVTAPVKAAPGDKPSSVRLCHDTLAPVVRDVFARSQAPGQRARRLLDFHTSGAAQKGATLSGWELGIVRAGERGMRMRTDVEKKLVARSAHARRVRRALGSVALVAVALLTGFGV